ncbi:hypothetical protein [Pedobacter frigoris]|uniref:Uncharacterized protein n=1 Tax=Pedobacter frigoris TaxID=2571272 RepID=A0A4U1CSL8_9SPHI|nr:hypothetical protein [Pedobacter frigoris]TKC08929.1 hypothetical protein FA047_02200 [Pedobacter frigoris]
MRTGIFLALMLGMLNLASVAQQLPTCIEQLNRKSDITTTKFERVITLKGNRTVYEFSITSKRECIHCARGTIFYDGNCNVVASFITSRGFKGFVEDGYTAAELGYLGYPNIKYRPKEDPLPSCIEKVLVNADSLNKAGVSKIVQVRMKDKILYGFEHLIDPKLANCKDCPRSIVYYNADCKPEVTFRVGGIAGVKGNNGYTGTDYNSKQILNILWRTK